MKLPTHLKNKFTLKFPLDLTEFTEQYGLPVLFTSYIFLRVLTHCVRAYFNVFFSLRSYHLSRMLINSEHRYTMVQLSSSMISISTITP